MSARDELLKKLTTLDFMLIDMGLYLNTHPDDRRAIAIHNQISADADALRKEFEAKFGPLCARTANEAESWQWINQPWPWEEESNFSL